MARSGRAANAGSGTRIRCGIYTRKSSEEGLEQEFNSLDAQREACEAFIASQKHEGWIALPEMYDDGGISGGTLERPALTRLLADIEAQRIDTVVVYKVDRLTRALGDFAKIVEIFDRQTVSFVSVTQQFNTTTSIGRLTLNMLLSFAQFEREVTGERIRDKIAASKKKGMWMGGVVPLGYDVRDRKLVINEEEAETVRHIYRRYADLGSVRALKDELDHGGVVSKLRIDRFGRQTGGQPLSRGALYLLLQNRLYRGRITHKDTHYPGEHGAIVDEGLWDEVKQKLATNRIDRKRGTSTDHPSLLMGLVFDAAGALMTPSHSTKKGRRYRYYVSNALIRGNRRGAPGGLRVPAGDLEALVGDRLRQFLSDQGAVYAALETSAPDVEACRAAMVQASELARRWPALSPAIRRKLFMRFVERVDVKRDVVEIAIVLGPVLALSWNEDEQDHAEPSAPDDDATITLSVPARLKRIGIETRLLVDAAGEDARRATDRSLVRLIAQAHRFLEMVMQGRGKTISELADEAGVGSSYFSRILRLGFLAPDLVKAILRGTQPIELTANQLAANTHLPPGWDDQRARFGTDVPSRAAVDGARRPCTTPLRSGWDHEKSQVTAASTYHQNPPRRLLRPEPPRGGTQGVSAIDAEIPHRP